MINNKLEYKQFLEADKKALFIEKRTLGITDVIWKYERLLRKTEYYHNCRKDFLGKIWGIVLKYVLYRNGIRLGFTIPINVCDAGLSLVHYGSITINSNAKIGKNCRIYNDVVIGSKGFGGGA